MRESESCNENVFVLYTHIHTHKNDGSVDPRKMAGARVLSFFELANVECLEPPQQPQSPFSPLFSASSSCMSPRSGIFFFSFLFIRTPFY